MLIKSWLIFKKLPRVRGWEVDHCFKLKVPLGSVTLPLPGLSCAVLASETGNPASCLWSTAASSGVDRHLAQSAVNSQKSTRQIFSKWVVFSPSYSEVGKQTLRKENVRKRTSHPASPRQEGCSFPDEAKEGPERPGGVLEGSEHQHAAAVCVSAQVLPPAILTAICAVERA